MTAKLSGPLARPVRRLAVSACALALIGVAVGRVHMRVQTTLIGYEIGRMKTEESTLLEERSALKMQLAKLTTKKHLVLMTDGDEEKDTPIKGNLALQ